MRSDAAIVDLTNASIVADKLEESFLECKEEDKDAYIYYILSVHGHGHSIIFCTSVAALRHVSSLLRILGINVCNLHAQMQQRARLKAIDHFCNTENEILLATDVVARGLDIPGVRTVVHYQLPHSAEVYVHRSGRTARALTDGCSVALISPNDRLKFASLCRSFSKFSISTSSDAELVGMRLKWPVLRELVNQCQTGDKGYEGWIKQNAELVELDLEDNDSGVERVKKHNLMKASSFHLKELQQDPNKLLARPLQPRLVFPTLLQRQLEELARQQKVGNEGRRELVVIGQDCPEPLQALRRAGSKVSVDMKELAEKRKKMENLKKRRKNVHENRGENRGKD
ncbi:hypothetical protein Ancab_030790 [Ancistrocladus abbreviatus]